MSRLNDTVHCLLRCCVPAGRLQRASAPVLLLDGRQLGPISAMQSLPVPSSPAAPGEAKADAGHAAFFQVALACVGVPCAGNGRQRPCTGRQRPCMASSCFVVSEAPRAVFQYQRYAEPGTKLSCSTRRGEGKCWACCILPGGSCMRWCTVCWHWASAVLNKTISRGTSCISKWHQWATEPAEILLTGSTRSGRRWACCLLPVRAHACKRGVSSAMHTRFLNTAAGTAGNRHQAPTTHPCPGNCMFCCRVQSGQHGGAELCSSWLKLPQQVSDTQHCEASPAASASLAAECARSCLTKPVLQDAFTRLGSLVLLSCASAVVLCSVGSDARLAILHTLQPPAGLPASTPRAAWTRHADRCAHESALELDSLVVDACRQSSCFELSCSKFWLHGCAAHPAATDRPACKHTTRCLDAAGAADRCAHAGAADFADGVWPWPQPGAHLSSCTTSL